MARGDFCLPAEGTRGHGLDKPRESRLSVSFESPQPSGKLRGHKDGKEGAGPSPPSSSSPGHPAGLSRVTAGQGAQGCPCVLRDVRPSPQRSPLRIPGPSLPCASPSAQPDGSSPGEENERNSGAFGKVARSGLPPRPPTLHPRGRGGCPPNPAGFAPSLGAFPESLPSPPRCELVARTNCCDSPSGPFSPPPPRSERGVSVHGACRTPCRSRVRK